MIIATFMSSNQIIIGCREVGKVDNIRTIDSRILFEDPEKLVGRFLSLIPNLFKAEPLSKGDRLLFALPGNLNSETKTIIDSPITNGISPSKLFDGFNFVEAFGEIVGVENIFLINDSDCIALSYVFNYMKLPALSIYIDEGVGVSVIKESGIVNYGNAIRPIEKLGGKTAYDLLCDKGIDNIMLSEREKLFERYTLNLVEVIKDINKTGKNDGFSFKQIFVYSTKGEFILEELAGEEIDGVDVSFIKYGKKENLFRAMLDIVVSIKEEDTSAYPNGGGRINAIGNMGETALDSDFVTDVLSDTFPTFELGGLQIGKRMLNSMNGSRIVKTEYHTSTGEIFKTFGSFKEFVEHWVATKPIAFSENYYSVNYSDNTKMKIYISDLNSITDLLRYKF